MKRLLQVLLAVLLLYLFFWPVHIQPERWKAEKRPPMQGIYETNYQLELMNRHFEGICLQCEDVAVDSSGYIYGGTESGIILKLNKNKADTLANTGGRPLGLHIDGNNNVIVADARKGLLSISPDGHIDLLTDTHEGIPFRFTDDVDIAADGKIYFSDASHKFNIDQYKYDFIERTPNGRLLVYDPADQTTTLLMDSLYFANGVALGRNDEYVLVNETSAHRVRRYWLEGPQKGTSDIFLDNLPFYPDGISYNEHGIFWIAMMSPRNKMLDGLSKFPFIRKVFVRIPPRLMPKPKNYAFVLGVNDAGDVLFNLQHPKGKFAQITSAQQFNGSLYLGSLSEPAIAILELKQLTDM
jgi:sugar lactone lactonase YvrE